MLAAASPLVAAVAGELITRIGDPEVGEELPVIEPADPKAMIADVSSRAQSASKLLEKERRFRDELSHVLND